MASDYTRIAPINTDGCAQEGIYTYMFWEISICLPTVINIPPQDTTTFLNKTEVFRCQTSDGDFTFWRVNGTSFTDLPLEVKDDLRTDPLEDRDNTLSIPAKAVYNGTTVQCVTGDYDIGGVAVESENATLTIQGICHK